ncbi:MAG: hypothetical protein KGL39_44060 [Patescibacteria group bacterium]|nr:hypothetical protein [Patescibacteria group bacterium]
MKRIEAVLPFLPPMAIRLAPPEELLGVDILSTRQKILAQKVAGNVA